MPRLTRSLRHSMANAVKNDPEIKKTLARHPRFFNFAKKRLSPHEKYGLILTIGVLITLFFIYLFFGVIRDIIGQTALEQSDLRIINLIQTFRTPTLNQIILFITYLGKWQIVFFGGLALSAFLILTRRWYYLITLVISTGGGEIIVASLKYIIARPRPALISALISEPSYSFPSGHSFVAFSFYGLIAYFLFRSVKHKSIKTLAIFWGLFMIIVIGFSRLYLGAHWPSDVLASYASGAAWLAVLITALEIRTKFHPSVHLSYLLKKPLLGLSAAVLFILFSLYTISFYQTNPLPSPPITFIKPIIISPADIPQNIFSTLPRQSEDLVAKPIEPISIIIISTPEQLNQAFLAANWVAADPISTKSIWHLAINMVFDRPYPAAPGTPAFWNGLPNNLMFEQPSQDNSARARHHIHIWQTPFILANKQRIWVATAHFDQTVKFAAAFYFPTHIIDPAVDVEREKVVNNLQKTGLVIQKQKTKIVDPMLGSNSANSPFFTDGQAEIIYLK